MGQLLFGHLGDILSQNIHISPGGLFQPRQLVQKGGFAGAGGAQNAADLSLRNLQIDAVQGHHHLRTHPVGLP